MINTYNKNQLTKSVSLNQSLAIPTAQQYNLTKKCLDLAPVIFVAIDANEKVCLINKNGCEILGYAEDEVIGKNWFDSFLPENYRTQVRAVFKKLLNGEIAAYKYYENPILTKQGEERIIAWHNTVLTDDAGNIIGTLSSGEDITERKLAEETLRKSNQLLEKTVNSLREAVFIIDARTVKILNCNPAATEIFGYTKEEMLNRTTTFLHIDENALQLFRKHLYQAIAEKGFLSNFEFKMKRKDGTIFPTEHSVMPIFDEQGERVAWVSVVRDITERKQLEVAMQKMNEELERKVKERTAELERANKELRATQEQFLRVQRLEVMGTLASGIAHDFNNFLTTIMANLSLLKIILKEELKPDATEFVSGRLVTNRIIPILNRVASVTRSAKDLTQRLLIFAKGDKPVKKVASIPKLINDSMTITLGGSAIRCELSIASDIWLVEVDEGQIVQALNNILVNARQAMPNGGTIKITVENVKLDLNSQIQLPKGNYVKIAIKDTGVGIPEANLPKIFEPFFTTKPKGTGLGLATVYSIIQRHNGAITVESKIGSGTTFTIYLPALTEYPNRIQNEQVSTCTIPTLEISFKRTESKGKVLIMDDEKEILETTETLLNYFGYEVEGVNDGKEAIEKYQKAKASGKPFDCIIMDLTVRGGMGGKETIEELLKIDPKVKAIVCSGYSSDETLLHFQRYGFCAKINKPYEAEELIKTLQEVINDKGQSNA